MGNIFKYSVVVVGLAVLVSPLGVSLAQPARPGNEAKKPSPDKPADAVPVDPYGADVNAPAPTPPDTAQPGTAPIGGDGKALDPPDNSLPDSPDNASPDSSAQATPDVPPADGDEAGDDESGDPDDDVEAQKLDQPKHAYEDVEVKLPLLFTTPTGHLLPAGVMMASAGLDTGGGFNGDFRIGLGDVAEFGVDTTSLIRIRSCAECESSGVSPPYPTALFKMGTSEGLFNKYFPALALGFRKSFENEHDNRITRVAQLYLVASKSLGSKVKLHAGAVFWDASIKQSFGNASEVLLHDQGVGTQLRGFGGVEVQPLPRSQILLELNWAPEFAIDETTGTDSIELRPTLSWGVRYELASWAVVESGVRIPDIADLNLIDAQIFGQFRFVTRRFRRYLNKLN